MIKYMFTSIPQRYYVVNFISQSIVFVILSILILLFMEIKSRKQRSLVTGPNFVISVTHKTEILQNLLSDKQI